MNMNTYFQTFLQGLTKSITMWILRIHSLKNNIHLEWILQSKNILGKKIQYLLDYDSIESSLSEWCSPYIFVPKPDGSYRMC